MRVSLLVSPEGQLSRPRSLCAWVCLAERKISSVCVNLDKSEQFQLLKVHYRASTL